METRDVEQRAQALFESGLNCAEAVLTAVLAGQGVTDCAEATRLGTAFGAGVGRSKEELCGALSGGLIALGFSRDPTGEARSGTAWPALRPVSATASRPFTGAHARPVPPCWPG